MHKCGGVWKPLIGWSGRYRCNKCKVIGYRYANAPKSYKHTSNNGSIGFSNCPENIIPYKCSVKNCKNGAVKKIRKGTSKKWMCSKHYEKKAEKEKS